MKRLILVAVTIVEIVAAIRLQYKPLLFFSLGATIAFISYALLPEQEKQWKTSELFGDPRVDLVLIRNMGVAFLIAVVVIAIGIGISVARMQPSVSNILILLSAKVVVASVALARRRI